MTAIAKKQRVSRVADALLSIGAEGFMKARMAIPAALVSFVAMSMTAPALLRAQQPSAAEQHDHGADASRAAPSGVHGPMMMPMMDMTNMRATMHANDQKIDDLVNKMNGSTGSAKVDAMAALLTALVQDRKQMHGAMMNMPAMDMTNMPPTDKK